MPACTPITDRFQTLSDSRSAIHITYSLPEVLFIVYASVLSGYNEQGESTGCTLVQINVN